MNISTLSKKFKSPEWKRKKKEKHERNKQLRSELESQKASFPTRRLELQAQIDKISLGLA